MKTCSALPFQIGNFKLRSIFTCEEKGPKEVAKTNSTVDTAFIVHACNSFHPLIEELQKALESASNANAQLFDMAVQNDAANAIRDAKEASRLLIDLQRDVRQALAQFNKK